MIEIKRDNKQVVIIFSTDLPFDCEGKNDCDYLFSYNFISPSIAELAKRYFKTRLREAIEIIREKEYTEGYVACRRHEKKKRFFRGWF